MGDPNMFDLLEAIQKLTNVVEDIREDLRAQQSSHVVISSLGNNSLDAAISKLGGKPFVSPTYKTNGVEFE